jgi:hypothetical protein
VFEGLLPEPHNSAVLDLLFEMAHWHGLAKLRMHHDLTLDVLESVTVSLGKLLRSFSDATCPAFATKELRREADARTRRESRKATAKHTHTSTKDASTVNAASPAEPVTGQQTPSGHCARGTAVGRRPKTFNPNTYKGHSYGDYAKSIRLYGTTDSYSTKIVRYAANHCFHRWLINYLLG